MAGSRKGAMDVTHDEQWMNDVYGLETFVTWLHGMACLYAIAVEGL